LQVVDTLRIGPAACHPMGPSLWDCPSCTADLRGCEAHGWRFGKHAVLRPAPRLLAARGARRARLAGASAAAASAKPGKPVQAVQAVQRRAHARLPPRRRIAKQDFELHGRRVRKGASLYLSGLYAKACDGRVSAGDHVATPMPAHMDMADLATSFQPERWLGPELDKAVRARRANVVRVWYG